MEKNFSNQLTTEKIVGKMRQESGAMLVQPEEDDELRLTAGCRGGEF